MRFLVDANLPRATIALLRRLRHEVEFARDIGLAAASDEQIAKCSQQADAVLITRDLDFSDVRRFPPDQYPGIVVLRLPDTAVANIMDIPIRLQLSPWRPWPERGNFGGNFSGGRELTAKNRHLRLH